MPGVYFTKIKGIGMWPKDHKFEEPELYSSTRIPIPEGKTCKGCTQKNGVKCKIYPGTLVWNFKEKVYNKSKTCLKINPAWEGKV